MARTEAGGSALVTDSALRTALFVIRSLGQRGVRITTVERATAPSANLGGLSRYVSQRVVVPDNRTDPDGWAAAVLDESSRGHDVLVPIGMHSIIPVAKRLEEFRRRTRVALAPLETIQRADDTPRLLDLARRIGLPVPRQYSLADYPDATALARDVRFPVIVKIGVEAGLPPAARYSITRTPEELVAAIARLTRYTPSPLIQDLIVGDGIGYETLYDFDHREVAAFSHRRLREFPLTGGPSTFCESIHHARAAEYATRLLAELRWVGLAMVEFKIDASSGEPVLMEINPRPWGSMALAIRSGVDFPWLNYRLARDGSLPPQGDWPDGVRLRYLLNDLQPALAAFRQAGSLRERLRIAASVLDPRVKEGVLSASDPRPSWAYLRKAFARAGGVHA